MVTTATFWARVRSLLKPLFIFGLVAILVFGDASAALAARSGGRIGGGGFRTPRTTAPRGGGGGGYRSPGGGIGFPFLFPFFGFGGFGSLFSILVVLALANFVINSLRGNGVLGGGDGAGQSNPRVTVAKVQVGLLADARELQQELTQLARSANTGMASGRAKVLQESALALLRHPEYWVYAAADGQQLALDSAESRFNQLALSERSKFGEETLSNVDSQMNQRDLKTSESGSAPSEYILVTLIAGVEGKLSLPSIRSSDDLRQALQAVAGVGSDRLMAVEVLWTPQAEGDSLTSDDLLAAYPDLKLI